MLLLHAENASPRARYTLTHLLGRMTGWSVAWAADAESFRSATGPKVHYGNSNKADACWLHASGALDRMAPGGSDPPLDKGHEVPVPYPSEHGGDIVAGTFFLLSRCEEYGPTSTDAHGRLKAEAHWMVRQSIERMPLVDRWMEETVARLRERWPGLPDTDRHYRHVATVDVDNGLMVLGRPRWKQWAAIARAMLKGKSGEAAMRRRVLRGAEPDPFDRFSEWTDPALTALADRFLVFLLMRGGAAHDHAADHRHPLWRQRIALLRDRVELALHPGYDSAVDRTVIPADRQRLEAITGSPVRISRQHFLRWRMPDTLRQLADLGFTEEHSMGFSDRPGFRAGTCTPFPWYDLEREEATELMLHPFAVMDSALHDRMGLDATRAASVFADMSDTVRAVRGTFVSVWHDRFVSGHGSWQGWPEAFQQLLLHARA